VIDISILFLVMRVSTAIVRRTWIAGSAQKRIEEIAGPAFYTQVRLSHGVSVALWRAKGELS